MIIDLKNSIPYLYSKLKQKYKDSSRFLGIAKPHHLIFDHSLKDMQYLRDVVKS
jgi:hypothetical protein